MNIACCIMAAGKGVRFKLDTHKLLVPIAGKSSLERVLGAVSVLEAQTHVVLHESQPDDFKEAAARACPNVIWQKSQDGTGGALADIVEALRAAGPAPTHLFVINGDMPCIEPDVVRSLCDSFRKAPESFYMVGTRFPFPTPFGRVTARDTYVEIREVTHTAALSAETEYLNVGIYWFPLEAAAAAIPSLVKHSPKDERYITDLFLKDFTRKAGVAGRMIAHPDWKSFMGLNDTHDLLRAEGAIQERITAYHATRNVHFKGAPAYMDESVEIESGATLYPGVTLLGRTRVGEGAIIESGATLFNAVIENGARVLAGSYIEDSSVGADSTVGPNAHLRSHTRIGARCRVGNYVEMKNTIFGDESKSAHLTYLGDAEIGAKVNIGCGTITCNYDGVSKHKTVIEDEVFVGSDVQFIAPIRIGKGAYIASGSTINQPLKADDFAIARAPQVTHPKLACRIRAKLRRKGK